MGNIKKTEQTFSQLEYAEEKKRKEKQKNEYVPAAGVYIWKFQGGKSAGLRFFLETNVLILILVLLVVVVLLITVYVAPLAEQYTGNELPGWLECIGLALLTGFLMLGAVHIGHRGNSMQLTFAKNGDGKLYVFDYRTAAFQDYLKSKWMNVHGMSAFSGILNVIAALHNNLHISKQIARIDREQIIENIMKSGRILPYGRIIVSVKTIEQHRKYCRIYCALRNPNGTLQDTGIILVKNYNHFDELMTIMESIQRSSTFDRNRRCSEYERYRPFIRVLGFVMPIVCAVLLAGCVVTRIANEEEDIFYQKVNVQVSEYQSGTSLLRGPGGPTVKVIYEGKEYKLKNALSGQFFYEGQYIQAYLSNGVLYANTAGIKTHTVKGRIYFVFLFSLYGSIGVWTLVYYIRRRFG